MVDLVKVYLDSRQRLVGIRSAALRRVFDKNTETLSGIGFMAWIN